MKRNLQEEDNYKPNYNSLAYKDYRMFEAFSKISVYDDCESKILERFELMDQQYWKWRNENRLSAGQIHVENTVKKEELAVDEWKSLAFLGYSKYSINQKGHIKREGSEKFFDPVKSASVRPRTSMTNDSGEKKQEYASRLVLLAFRNYPNKDAAEEKHYTVRHLDDCLSNCNLSNLIWQPKNANRVVHPQVPIKIKSCLEMARLKNGLLRPVTWCIKLKEPIIIDKDNEVVDEWYPMFSFFSVKYLCDHFNVTDPGQIKYWETINQTTVDLDSDRFFNPCFAYINIHYRMFTLPETCNFYVFVNGLIYEDDIVKGGCIGSGHKDSVGRRIYTTKPDTRGGTKHILKVDELVWKIFRATEFIDGMSVSHADGNYLNNHSLNLVIMFDQDKNPIDRTPDGNIETSEIVHRLFNLMHEQDTMDLYKWKLVDYL